MKTFFKFTSILFISTLISCGGDASTESKSDPNNTLFAPDNSAAGTGSELPVTPGEPLEPVEQTATAVETMPGKINPAHGEPGHICELPVGQVIPDNYKPKQGTQASTTPIQSITPQSNTDVKPGMNPAHGQPGHRCDIAVGAPLKDAPATPATPTTTDKPSNEPNINYPVVSSPLEYKVDHTTEPVVKVAEGMNPSHGQPGHRCDIAVGAPLEKKPDNN